MRLALLVPLGTAAAVAGAVTGAAGAPRGPTSPTPRDFPPRTVMRPASVPGVADSVVVSTAWLAAHLRDPGVVVLEVDRDDSAAARGHIPGARLLSFARIAAREGTLDAELPPVAELRTTFERLGVSDASRVVLSYAREAPSATRAFVALDYLGHDRVSLLDGGLARWQAEGRPVTTAWPHVASGVLHPRPRAERIATAQWISARLGRPGMALIDTRTDGEYLGTAARHGMPSAGHLPGARQLQWEQLFRGDSGSAAGAMVKAPAELQRIFAERMQSGDTVVTYCWVGYRASATYVAARALGLPVKLYDGSYQDWAQRRLPVRAGPMP